jgi:hypothetical protein
MAFEKVLSVISDVFMSVLSILCHLETSGEGGWSLCSTLLTASCDWLFDTASPQACGSSEQRLVSQTSPYRYIIGEDIAGRGCCAFGFYHMNLAAILLGLGKHQACLGIGVFQIAVMTSLAGAVMHTGWDGMRRVRGVPGVLHTIAGSREMIAERTLFDDVLLRVEPTDAGSDGAFVIAVRAGGQAYLATDAGLLIDQHDVVVLVAIGGTGGTNGYAGRVLALLAVQGYPVHINVGVGTDGLDVRDMAPVVAECDIVLELAGDHTGVAARAAVEVDDEGSLIHY